MSEPLKEGAAKALLGGTATCPICLAEMSGGKAIVGHTPTGERVGVLVCPRHLLPDWLRNSHPRLSIDSPRAAVHTIRWSLAERDGRPIPSLRRPVVRTDLPGAGPGPAAVPPRRSRVGWCDRAVELLATLFARLFTAGEPARKEPPIE